MKKKGDHKVERVIYTPRDVSEYWRSEKRKMVREKVVREAADELIRLAKGLSDLGFYPLGTAKERCDYATKFSFDKDTFEALKEASELTGIDMIILWSTAMRNTIINY